MFYKREGRKFIALEGDTDVLMWVEKDGVCGVFCGDLKEIAGVASFFNAKPFLCHGKFLTLQPAFISLLQD
ncbi:MAG: hypothetical protein HUK08_05670 [Bacteroidaceae bacterium]|nr:hypothetical protein [Bacteroidaceae bacterium]